MAFDTHPVTPDRVDDFVDGGQPQPPGEPLLVPVAPADRARRSPSSGTGAARSAFRALCGRTNPPGVIGYDDGEPVGWCSIGPRSENTRLSRSTLIRPLDDLPVWSIICVVIRGGHRKRGHTTP